MGRGKKYVNRHKCRRCAKGAKGWPLLDWPEFCKLRAKDPNMKKEHDKAASIQEGKTEADFVCSNVSSDREVFSDVIVAFWFVTRKQMASSNVGKRPGSFYKKRALPWSTELPYSNKVYKGFLVPKSPEDNPLLTFPTVNLHVRNKHIVSERVLESIKNIRSRQGADTFEWLRQKSQKTAVVKDSI